MKSVSYWEKTAFSSEWDVAIIGSGIVGLSAAFYLKNTFPKSKVLVIEQGGLPSGASSKNAGFACFGSMTELVEDVKNMGEDKVFALIQNRWEGLMNLRQLLGDKAIQFQQNGGHEIFLDEHESSFQECASHIGHFNHNLKSIVGKENVFSIKDEWAKQFGFAKTRHLIFNYAEGQLHPGKMMKALINKNKTAGVEIWNGLKVQAVNDSGHSAALHFGGNFSIQTKKAIVATNGFAAELLHGLDLKPARNQVLLSEPIIDLPFKGCFHLDRGYYYFRDVASEKKGEQRILLGGGRNLDPEKESTSAFGLTAPIQSKLEVLLREIIFPERPLEIEMRWSGILGVGKTKQPILKKASPSVLAAVRLSGIGLAIGSLLGKKAAEIIKNEF